MVTPEDPEPKSPGRIAVIIHRLVIGSFIASGAASVLAIADRIAAAL